MMDLEYIQLAFLAILLGLNDNVSRPFQILSLLFGIIFSLIGFAYVVTGG